MELQPLLEKGEERELRRMLEQQEVHPLPDGFLQWEVPQPVIAKPPTPPPPPPPPPSAAQPAAGGCGCLLVVWWRGCVDEVIVNVRPLFLWYLMRQLLMSVVYICGIL